jgi:hypothetical protein
MTMNITKTLMLAAVTALSLGAGAAMAQSEVPSSPDATYFSVRHQTAPKIIRIVTEGAGSSDGNFSRGNTPAHFDYSDLANPG